MEKCYKNTHYTLFFHMGYDPISYESHPIWVRVCNECVMCVFFFIITLGSTAFLGCTVIRISKFM
jgi:hypothetical protein